MGLIDDITLGRFLERHSALHRLDPRVKLLGLPALIIADFASHSPLRLVLLGALAVVLMTLSRVEARVWWRGALAFRWLLLFTLLLHILLSPGRTLWGLSWISLDGLLLGIRVCAQLLLAVIFSSMITLTTRPQEIVGGFSSLLRPLGRLGVPVEQSAMHLLLVLHFIPVLREEAGKAFQQHKTEVPQLGRGSLLSRGRVLRSIVGPLLLGLLDRADDLARDICAGRQPLGEPVVLKSLWALQKEEWLWVMGAVAYFAFLFSL